MKNSSSFSFSKVAISGIILAGSIYAIYAGVDAVTRPPVYENSPSISSYQQPQKNVATMVNDATPGKRGLAFLEMPVYSNNQDDLSSNKKDISYTDYQEKSKQEVNKVFTALRNAGNSCFNQWPVGSFDETQVEIQIGAYLSGCTREQLLKMAATANAMADMNDTASSAQPYRLVEAALEHMPSATDKEKRETVRRLQEITLARDAAMSREYAELDNIYASQCQGSAKNSMCEEIKSRIANYLTIPPSPLDS